MRAFVYQANPARVVFGAGALQQLPAEIERLGAHRALVLCTPGQRAAGRTGGRRCWASGRPASLPRAVMHVPIETARAARDEARRLGADCAVAIGGGSTTGLGKAIALDSGLPILAIPTTYAGSEMTPIYGITEGGLKKTGQGPARAAAHRDLRPRADARPAVGHDRHQRFNAIAHAAEGLYAPDGNPVIALMAEEGIRAAPPRCPAA